MTDNNTRSGTGRRISLRLTPHQVWLVEQLRAKLAVGDPSMNKATTTEVVVAGINLLYKSKFPEPAPFLRVPPALALTEDEKAQLDAVADREDHYGKDA